MNWKIKELLEAIMEEAMGIGGGTIDTSTSAFGTLPNSVVGSENKFKKESNPREHKGQLNYKYRKISKKKGIVQ